MSGRASPGRCLDKGHESISRLISSRIGLSHVQPNLSRPMSNRVDSGQCLAELVSSRVSLNPCRCESIQTDVEPSRPKPMSSRVSSGQC